MGKLYTKYKSLKGKDTSMLYLFRSGIFYIGLDEDAKKLTETLGLKLTNFDGNTVKCGFPSNSLETYLTKLQDSNINFRLIDNSFDTIESPEAYLNSMNIKKIIETLKNIDMDSTSPKEAYDVLYKLKSII